MKHADRLIERILFLGGLPNLQDLDKLLIGENVQEILECDLKLEQQAMVVLREAIQHAESVRDYISRELFEDILEGEEAACRFHRDPVRADRPHRDREIHAAAVGVGGVAAAIG